MPTDGSAPLQLTRGDSKDASPCFRRDGALGFLSNRQPNEIKPDEEAEKRMQVWLLPAAGGEPQQLTDEPLGVEAFRFARARGPPRAAGARAVRTSSTRSSARSRPSGARRAAARASTRSSPCVTGTTGCTRARRARTRTSSPVRATAAERRDLTPAGTRASSRSSRRSTCRPTASRSPSRGRPPARIANSTPRSC